MAPLRRLFEFSFLAMLAVWPAAIHAQDLGNSSLDPVVVEQLVTANRILASEGVVDAFGHVSIRDPRNPSHYLQSRSIPPAQVTAADIIVFDLDGRPIDPNVKCGCYVERFIHAEIYKARPDVNAVIHTHSPTVVPFSVVPSFPLRPILLNAAFLPPEGAPVFDTHSEFGATNMLMLTPEMGRSLAMTLGQSSVVLMRGHGDAVVGPTIETAVWRAYFTEVNAKMLIAAHSLGGPITFIDADEARKADQFMQGKVAMERAWAQWKQRLAVPNNGKN